MGKAITPIAPKSSGNRTAAPSGGKQANGPASSILKFARRVIELEARAVAQLANRLDGQFERAVELLLKCKGRVIVTGLGKSGIVGRKIAATLSSTGTPAFFLHAAEGIHGDLGLVKKGDLVIAISKSGSTEEVFLLFPIFRRLGVPVISITGNPRSPMAEKSDVVLDVSVEEEACPNNLAPTSSSTAALVMGDALALAVLEERNFSPEDFALLHPGGSLGRKLWLKVEDLMHTGVDIPKVTPTTPVKEAILEMTSKRLGATTVVNEKDELVGIFTDGDLRRLVEKKKEFMELFASDVMSASPKTTRPEALAAAALNQMEEHKITVLAVTSGRRLVGVLHLHDLLQAGVI
ncbi:MAG TPA: KpsF/GutQ family sugar-phosphate isomerase [candidate division Zixibacteria bacterium]|nr:KpsF/GutQ family sugar-phosphate isomerase [candidate division Zixibacteria bacterium]